LSLSFFEKATQLLTADKNPTDYVAIQFDLVKIYKNSNIGSKLENYEKGIFLFDFFFFGYSNCCQLKILAFKHLLSLSVFFEDSTENLLPEALRNEITQNKNQTTPLSDQSTQKDSQNIPSTPQTPFNISQKNLIFRSIAKSLSSDIKNEIQFILKELLKLYTNHSPQKLQSAKELYKVALMDSPSNFFKFAKTIDLK